MMKPFYQLEKNNVICSYQRIHTNDWKRCVVLEDRILRTSDVIEKYAVSRVGSYWRSQAGDYELYNWYESAAAGAGNGRLLK